MSKSSTSSDLREASGFIGGLVNQGRLSWRLLNDGRVSGWVKMIPLFAVLYFLSPIDLIPDWAIPGLGEVDDVVILLLALKMFVDLSPAGIVGEHLEDLFGTRNKARPADEVSSGPYIDAPYRVLDEASTPDENSH